MKKYIKIDDSLPDLFFRFRRYLLAVLFLFSALRLFAPDSKTITIIKEPAIEPFSGLLYATAMVETMGNSMAFNEFENAVGIFQIRQVRIDDYNRRTGSNHSLTEMFDPLLSRKIFLYYASRYEPHELEKIAKAWNGSGPMTEFYWKRIKEYLN